METLKKKIFHVAGVIIFLTTPLYVDSPFFSAAVVGIGHGLNTKFCTMRT